jgi:hypothetical protein
MMCQFGIANASNECMRCGSVCTVAVGNIARTNDVDRVICIARSNYGNCSSGVSHAGDLALSNMFFENEQEPSTTSAFKVLSSVINWMVYHPDSFKEQCWGVKFLNHLVGTESHDPCTAVISLLQVMLELVHDIQIRWISDEKYGGITPDLTRLENTLKVMWNRRRITEPQTRGRCTCTDCRVYV